MQSIRTLFLLIGAASAFTPTQVKDDLDTHPWRPTPSTPAPKTALPSASPSKPNPFVVAQPPTPQPVVQGGVWQLQLAALSSLEAARSEQKRLEKILGPGKVEILTEGAVNRLRFGAYPSKEAAEAGREELNKKGLEGFPVKKP